LRSLIILAEAFCDPPPAPAAAPFFTVLVFDLAVFLLRLLLRPPLSDEELLLEEPEELDEPEELRLDPLEDPLDELDPD